MRRRNLIVVLGATFATWPLAVRTQSADKVVGVSCIGTSREDAFGHSIYQAFLDEMGKLGFSEGQNPVIEFRSNEQAPTAVAFDAAELVRSTVDLIGTDGTETPWKRLSAPVERYPL